MRHEPGDGNKGDFGNPTLRRLSCGSIPSVFPLSSFLFPLVLSTLVLLTLALTGCKSKAPTAEGGDDAEVKAVVQVSLARAHRQDVEQTLNVTGTVSPLANREAKVAPVTAGRIKTMNVRIGQFVSKGQVLATLDPGPVNGQIVQAQATVQSDEAALKQAQINYSAQLATQKSSVVQAQQNLQAQQIALNKLLAGPRPQEVAQAEATVTSAQAAYTNAEQNLSRSQTLFAEGLMARKDLEAAQSAAQSAAAQLRTAQEALSLTKAGNRSQDIQAGRIAVQQAQEQLNVAKAAELQNRSKQQDVQIAKQALQNARGALQSARAQLAALTIRAPLSGVITGRTLNAGEWLDTTGSAATIADLTTVRLLLQVPVAQSGQIHVGQEVQFTNDAAPNTTRSATITTIGKAVDPATNTVTVEAEANNRDLALKDDTFVKGSILLTVHRDVLVVPTSALVTKDDKTVVFVVGSDKIAHSKPVQVIVEEKDVAEVKGIQAGDQVVTTGAYELEDGTQVEPNS